MHKIVIMGNKRGKNGGCHDGRRGAVFNCFGQFEKKGSGSADICGTAFDHNSTMGNTVKSWRNDQNRNRAKVGKCTRLPTIPRVSLPTIYNRTSFDDSGSLAKE